MSRVAGLAIIAIAALASSPALAQGSACRGAEAVKVRYQEQICQRGVGGYSDCRWIEREHVVQAPSACATALTVEQAGPATRGEFPPYRRIAPRG